MGKEKLTKRKGLSQRAYAKHRGCALRAVQQAIEAGRLTRSVVRTDDGKYLIDPKRADIEWAASTYADRVPLTGPTAPTRGAPDDEDPVSLMQARNRLELAKAQLAEMDLAERRGEILDAHEVEARMVGVFSSCKTKLLGIPSRVRQEDPTLTKAQIAILELSIRAALEDLAVSDLVEAEA
jgi:phage terminase Nu1 subunit (DNA packaging protein)